MARLVHDLIEFPEHFMTIQANAKLLIPDASGNASSNQMKRDSSIGALYQLDPRDSAKTVTSIRTVFTAPDASSADWKLPRVVKYKPKFSVTELLYSPLKYASVLITKATQPRSIYIRIQDEQAPLYQQLLNELELEFRSVTNRSASYCSSPIIGAL